MKIKERALSLLLSLVMMLTFMPALAFAEGDEPADANGTPAVEEAYSEEALIENPVVEESKKEDASVPEKTLDSATPEKVESSANAAGFDEDAIAELSLAGNRELVYNEGLNFPQEGDKFVVTFSDDSKITYTFDADADYEFVSTDGKTLLWTYNPPAAGDTTITFNVWDSDNTFDIYFDYDATVEAVAVSLSFSPNAISLWGPSITETDSDGSTYYSINKRYHWTYPDGSTSDYRFALGDTATVTYSNGEVKTYRCETAYVDGEYDAWFVCGEEYEWPNLFLESDLVPGNNVATIWFKDCETTINIFIDTPELQAQRAAAAAEAARQGTPGSLPGVKASKPKAAKKAITVKWKKLNKKQLKSGVSNIEVWVCSDGAFANGSTIEKVVGKKKSSLKIKGLQKGVTYYAKVRTITYSGGAKIVGPWSAVKTVKVKK